MNKYKNATEAFESNYRYVMAYGRNYAGTKAVFNQSFEIINPLDRIITTPSRKFKQEYADFEWCWYQSGNRDAREISERAQIWKSMMIPGTNQVNSNYGYYWKYNNQLPRMIDELKLNPQTRRAMLVHYKLDELDRYKYDTPCNVVLNFYYEDERLNLTVFARSIDLWYGFCNDFYTFSKLMEHVSEKTGYQVGRMHFFITNLHLYEKHWDKFK